MTQAMPSTGPPGAPVQPAPQPQLLASNMTRGGGFGLGTVLDRRHTRRVAVLKRVLPATGACLLLLIAMWPRLAPLWDRMRLSFPPIDLRDAQELRMVNPRYSGIDREGRPFVVTAASGRQIPDRQDLMSLQAPRADLKTQGGAEITVNAVSAVYQAQAQLLDLFGDVTLTHQNGTRFVTQSARVNAAQNTAEGSDPIAGHGPGGDIKAQGFRILEKGATIVFTGQSDVLLNAAKRVAANSAPPGLPAPVAKLAAETEANATLLLAAEAEVEAKTPSVPHHAQAARKPAKSAGKSRPRSGRTARKKR